MVVLLGWASVPKATPLPTAFEIHHCDHFITTARLGTASLSSHCFNTPFNSTATPLQTKMAPWTSVTVSSLLCDENEPRRIEIETRSAAFVYREAPEHLPGPGSLAYPGHEAFTNGSMGMSMLTGGFAELPNANSNADVEMNYFQDPSNDSPESSIDYRPHSTPRQPGDQADMPLGTNQSLHDEEPSEKQCRASSHRLVSPDLPFSPEPYRPRSPGLPFSPEPYRPKSPLLSYSTKPVPTDNYSQCIYSEASPPRRSGPPDEEPRPQRNHQEYQHDHRMDRVPAQQSHYYQQANFQEANHRGKGAQRAPSKCSICLRLLELPSNHEDRVAHYDRYESYYSRTNSRITRYDDGEIIRYGAGESYRPFNNRDRDRSPRRARSPLRDRDRERDRERDRDRDHRPRTPPIGSDSYVPNRSPRRRSRSADRYRGPDRARDVGGESWRRRDNSRGRLRSPPVRRISPRRSPRRSPGRYSPPMRRDDRFDRARSPRREFEIRDR